MWLTAVDRLRESQDKSTFKTINSDLSSPTCKWLTIRAESGVTAGVYPQRCILTWLCPSCIQRKSHFMLGLNTGELCSLDIMTGDLLNVLDLKQIFRLKTVIMVNNGNPASVFSFSTELYICLHLPCNQPLTAKPNVQ